MLNDWFTTDLDLAGVPTVSLPDLVDLVDLKPVGTVELAHLVARLHGRDVESVLADPAREDTLVRAESEDGPWVVRVADATAADLAGLDDARAAALAEAWRHIDLWKWEGTAPPVDEVRAWLDDLRAICRDARAAGTPVYRVIAV